MIKYSDQDEKHLEDQIEKERDRQQEGDKTAADQAALRKMLEDARKGRIRED